jgi:hypothetical protein
MIFAEKANAWMQVNTRRLEVTQVRNLPPEEQLIATAQEVARLRALSQDLARLTAEAPSPNQGLCEEEQRILGVLLAYHQFIDAYVATAKAFLRIDALHVHLGIVRISREVTRHINQLTKELEISIQRSVLLTSEVAGLAAKMGEQAEQALQEEDDDEVE